MDGKDTNEMKVLAAISQHGECVVEIIRAVFGRERRAWQVRVFIAPSSLDNQHRQYGRLLAVVPSVKAGLYLVKFRKERHEDISLVTRVPSLPPR